MAFGKLGAKDAPAVKAREAKFAEHAEYNKIISTFYSCNTALPLKLPVWVDPSQSGQRNAAGIITNITESHNGTRTYDVRLSKVFLPGWETALEKKLAEFTDKTREDGERCFEIKELTALTNALQISTDQRALQDRGLDAGLKSGKLLMKSLIESYKTLAGKSPSIVIDHDLRLFGDLNVREIVRLLG